MSRFTLPRDIYYGANALENLKNRWKTSRT